jgi:branched-chain amino acid transport system ATP-binding protein
MSATTGPAPHGEAPAALRLSGVSAGYGRVTVVREVDLTVPPAGVVCLLGRNGAGKTTLLKSVMGLVPHTGSVELAGRNVSGWAGSRISREGVAWVPQEGGVFHGLSIREHLRLASRFDERRVTDEVLDRFPILRDRLEQHAQTLSGGERKMLGMALALIGEPRLVLLDEPTEGVAPVVVEQLITVIAGLARHCAVLLVEQNLDTALATATHAYVLEQGAVVESGDIQALHRDGVLEERLAV